MKVKEFETYNFNGARIRVPSDLNIENWYKYKSILSEPEVIDYLEFGFPLGFDYTHHPIPTHKNHKSALDYASYIDSYLRKEVEYKAMAGPFDKLPFTWGMVSPFMSGDKNEGTDRRVIVDLSYPPGNSVNDGIARDSYLGTDFKLQLPTALSLRDAIRVTGPGTVLWSTDLERAYRQLRLEPLDYPLMGLMWREKYYFDLSIAFGGRNGAKCCQQVTQSVVEILRSENHNALSYIDDLAGYSSDMNKATQAAARCSQLLTELGLHEAKSKATAPATNMTWLGISFDTQAMSMYIPPNKLNKVVSLAREWKDKKSATAKHIRQFFGRLFFLATCDHTLRLFVNRMTELLRGTFNDHDVIQLTTGFHEDLDWINTFLTD